MAEIQIGEKPATAQPSDMPNLAHEFGDAALQMARETQCSIIGVIHPDGDWDVFNATISSKILTARETIARFIEDRQKLGRDGNALTGFERFNSELRSMARMVRRMA